MRSVSTMRRVSCSLFVVATLCAAAAMAVRTTPDNLANAAMFGSLPASLRSMGEGAIASLGAARLSIASSLLQNGVSRHQEERRAITVIRFIVEPSQGEDFEKAWLKLDDKIQDLKDRPLIHSLESTTTDNVFYYGYSEFECMRDLHDYLHSKYFEDFTEGADSLNVKWELQFLKSASEDIDEAREQKGLERSKNLHSLLVNYYVPPGNQDKFEQDWLEEGDDTTREKGNVMVGLSKVLTDNTRYYGYGAWESEDALLDHYHSKHHQKLLDRVADNDIIFFASPMREVRRSKGN